MTHKEGLPIKIGAKVVKTYVKEKVVSEDDYSEDDNDDDDSGEDSDERADGSDSDSVNSFDYEQEKPSQLQTKKAKVDEEKRGGNDIGERVFKSADDARHYIGKICSSITANPDKALSKRRKTDNEADQEYPRVADLLELLSHSNPKIAEITMLSFLLVFKDICPSFRIRLENDDVQLKKDTKKKRDVDKSLLESYRKYINFLDTKARSGLGDVRKEVQVWDDEAMFGLSAFRCQCELIRNLFHFNFRSTILASVVQRAAQPNKEISSICLSSLDYIFNTDPEGEVTFEVVRLIAQILATLKYEVDEQFIRILDKVKLATHANDSSSIRKEVKLINDSLSLFLFLYLLLYLPLII